MPRLVVELLGGQLGGVVEDRLSVEDRLGGRRREGVGPGKGGQAGRRGCHGDRRAPTAVYAAAVGTPAEPAVPVGDGNRHPAVEVPRTGLGPDPRAPGGARELDTPAVGGLATA